MPATGNLHVGSVGSVEDKGFRENKNKKNRTELTREIVPSLTQNLPNTKRTALLHYLQCLHVKGLQSLAELNGDRHEDRDGRTGFERRHNRRGI